jgi:hypothetical protein
LRCSYWHPEPASDQCYRYDLASKSVQVVSGQLDAVVGCLHAHNATKPCHWTGLRGAQVGAVYVHRKRRPNHPAGWRVWNSAFWVHEGQKSHDPSSLDGVREITLLPGGQSSHPAREELSAFGDELFEQIGVFVIDRISGLNRRKSLFKKGGRHEGWESEGVG